MKVTSDNGIAGKTARAWNIDVRECRQPGNEFAEITLAFAAIIKAPSAVIRRGLRGTGSARICKRGWRSGEFVLKPLFRPGFI